MCSAEKLHFPAFFVARDDRMTQFGAMRYKQKPLGGVPRKPREREWERLSGSCLFCHFSPLFCGMDYDGYIWSHERSHERRTWVPEL